MKILMVSMQSIHFFRWTDQLKDSGHEVHWFDILDGAHTNKLSWVQKHVSWKQKFPKLKGRYFLKKRVPRLYDKFSFLIENNVSKTFEKILEDIQPDIVHSFVLYVSCAPIFNSMQKHPQIKWVYSSWGSDLFYFKNIENYYNEIIKVLPLINYLITDCKRDVGLATSLGFKGKVLGTFPGGGGFKIKNYESYMKLPVLSRRIILVKGYQGRSGRSINVFEALKTLDDELKGYEIVVFSADKELVDYLKADATFNKFNISIYERENNLSHDSILKLMGEALLYIGNSNSDGMPNTLLEAVIQGAFPIQSNPGGATSEIITHAKNGLLIEDCEDIRAIKQHVINVLSNDKMILEAFDYNQKYIKSKLDREVVKAAVLKAYLQVDL